MTSILFWNINKKPLLEEIVYLCHDHEIDILVLAECELSDVSILQAININSNKEYIAPYNLVSNLSLFYRYSTQSIIPVKDDRRTAIRSILLLIVMILLWLHCIYRVSYECPIKIKDFIVLGLLN